MYCRAGHGGSASSRGGDNGLDLVECAKRHKDEGVDASLSLDAIIALQGARSDRAAFELEAGLSSPSREKEDAPPPRWRYAHTAWLLLALGFVLTVMPETYERTPAELHSLTLLRAKLPTPADSTIWASSPWQAASLKP